MEVVVMAVLAALVAALEGRRVLLPPPQPRGALRPRQCPPLAAAAVAVETMEAVEVVAAMEEAEEVQVVAVQAAD